MKVQEKWLFCYWDEPIFEKEVKKTNNTKTKNIDILSQQHNFFET